MERIDGRRASDHSRLDLDLLSTGRKWYNSLTKRKIGHAKLEISHTKNEISHTNYLISHTKNKISHTNFLFGERKNILNREVK